MNQVKYSKYVPILLAMLISSLGLWLLMILAKDATQTPIWIIDYGFWVTFLSLVFAPFMFVPRWKIVSVSFIFFSGVVIAAVMMDGKLPQGRFIYPLFLF